MAEEQNSEYLSLFDDMMSDEGGVSSKDPFTNEGYDVNQDIDEFQSSSNSTQAINDDGYQQSSKGEDPFIDKLDDTDNLGDEDGLILEVLKSKNFNPNSIKIEDEDGSLKEYKFNELSKEDKIALLNSENDTYSESELEAINFLRENNMSLNDLAEAIKNNTLESLQNIEQSYTVDDFNDDELYIADFRNKFGEDFTDEELLSELDKAKENEELFNKKVSKLREDYKRIEDEELENQRLEDSRKQQEEYDNYVSNMTNIARSVSDMHNTVELDDNDKNDILNYMLTQNADGFTDMQKDLTNPETMFKVAWYLKNGDEVFKEIHKYYQDTISEMSKSNKNNYTQAIVKKTQHTTTNKRPLKLEDLY